MPRVRIERTDDDEFLAYRLVEYDKEYPLEVGLFVDPAIAAAYCRARRWPVVETVLERPNDLDALVAAEVAPEPEIPKPPRRGRGLAKASAEDRTAALF